MPASDIQPEPEALLAALSGSPVPTIVVAQGVNDESRRVLAASRSFDEVFGDGGQPPRTLAELWQQVCPGPDRTLLQQRWQAALNAAWTAGVDRIEPVLTRLRDRRGSVRHVSLHFALAGPSSLLLIHEQQVFPPAPRRGSGLRRAAGALPETRASASWDEHDEHDPDQRRDLEDLRREAQKLEAVGQLSAGVAHNFNNVLTAILPNLELALPEVEPETAELLRNAREAALHAAELVRQLVSFAGRDEPTAAVSTDVNALVQRTVRMCRGTFDRSIRLDVSVPDEPQPVALDQSQFEQALLNLLINARDAVSEASREGARVTIEVEPVPDGDPSLDHVGLDMDRTHVRVSVIDNGSGMDAATRERIFEPFFTTKESGHGTGLGLSTTRTIVGELSGIITCRSTPGVGTRFDVVLPRSSQPSEKRQSTAPPPPAGNQETILVVDDEASVRTAVARLLERQGYCVQVASDGAEAIALFEDDPPAFDLILLDLSMPGMSGRVVHDELRRIAPGTPIAYFTGYAREPPGNADAWIEKPIVGDRLMRVVRQVLDRDEEE